MGELQTVVHQAPQAACQLLSIAQQPVRHIGRDVQAQVQAFAQSLPGITGTHALQQITQAERRRLRTQAAGLQFGQGKNGINHIHHALGRPHRRAVVLGHLGLHRQGMHQLQRTDHAIHRRAQFMGHAGKEFVFQPVAPGQLQVQLLQCAPGVTQGLRLLLAQAVDAVGQRQRQ